MPRPFLTARWQDLALITYAVPRELLLAHLPPGLDLDERDGQVYASLVAFDFRDCRVRGVRWPGLVNFPEVNLRFYVREKSGGRRGVVFVREFVPSRVIAGVARWVYSEPYTAVPMFSSVTRTGGRVRVEHEVRVSRAGPMRIVAQAEESSFIPDEATADHFFKEHSWGYGVRRGRTLVYEVRHPVWEIQRGVVARVDADFAGVYGKEWGVLTGATPVHVMLAIGSAVQVLPLGAL